MSNKIKLHDQDFDHILTLINEARTRVYTKANAELVLLYFNVGKIVSEKVNAGNWGNNTVQQLSNFIYSKLPNLSGFNRRGLYRMKQFYETYSDDQFITEAMLQIDNNKISLSRSKQLVDNEGVGFVSSVVTQISWTHHLLILSKTKNTEEKIFYINKCISEQLSTRELERQLNTATFERTMLAKSTTSSITSRLPSEIFKDPYIFEFLALPDGHSEKEFEKAITLNLQKFILEIGKGFTYMGRQYRLQVGNKDFYTDLLFFHRDLQCLVLFELKIQEFEPEFLGKVNFYLEALDRDVKRPHENPSIGILLCKGKDTEIVEYAMARHTSPTIIADYETKLIPKNILANKLNQLVHQLSENRFE